MKLETRLHACLSARRPAFGVIAALNSPLAVEILAHGSHPDFMALDMQHAAVAPADAVHLLRAVQAADPEVSPLVRIPSLDKHWVEQSLDAGFVGLVLPLVESVEQARALVRAAHYPPMGARSVAGTIRASLYDGYMERIGERLILLPQIESREGLERCEQIADVPGVSGLLLGPADLSLSCGWSGSLWEQEPFVRAVQRVVAACRSVGKVAAIWIGDAATARRARDLGVGIIGFAADHAELRTSMAPRLSRELQELHSRQP